MPEAAESSVAESSWERERLMESLEAYRCGLTDAPVLHKWNRAEVRAGDGDQGEQMTFVISSGEVDRHGDVISPDGWRLDAYQRNPVFLWAHDYTRPVIGRALSVWKEPQHLMARMEFAPTEFAREVARLYRGGYQRGVSVGFKPVKYEERLDEKTGVLLGIRFLEQELLEVSAVPVPANRSALRRALDEAPRVGHYLRRQLPLASDEPFSELEAMWPELVARIDDLDKLVKELAGMVASKEPSQQEDLSQGDTSLLLAILRGVRW